MANLKTYDAAQVAMVFSGIPILGIAEGTFVSCERNEDSFTLYTGASGEAARAKTNNRSGRITFTLMQTSATNDLLSAVANIDENSPSGDGIGPFLMKDLTGRTIVAAEKAWIVKQPTTNFAGEASENREWVLETDELLFLLVGGN